jgi:hypothetical protein
MPGTAILAAGLRHVLAAIHAAVAVAVGTAAVRHGMALMLALLPGLMLAVLARLVLGVAGLRGLMLLVLLMLLMALMLGGRRGLRGGGSRQDQRDGAEDIFHRSSPEMFDRMEGIEASGEARRRRIGFGVETIECDRKRRWRRRRGADRVDFDPGGHGGHDRAGDRAVDRGPVALL